MDLSLWFTFLFIFLTLVITLNRKFRNKNLPPEAAGGWPLIGHLRLLSGPEPPHLILSRLADEYGPIFSIRLGAYRGVVVSSWEVAKECFTGANDVVFSQRPETEAVRHMSYGFAMFGLSNSGPYWREMRKVVMLKLLSNDRVSMLANLFIHEVEAGMKTLYQNNLTVVDMTAFFQDITFNVMVRVVAGGCQGLSSGNCRNAIQEFFKMFNVVTIADVLPFLKWLSCIGGMRKALKKTAEDLDKVLQAWLDEHKKQKKNGNKEPGGFMAEMVDISHRVSQEFPWYDAATINKATCQVVLLGGTDTTSVTLTWALSLLLNNRHVLEAAQQELDSQVGRTRHLHEVDIPNLAYIGAVVKETLRLYPAAPMLAPREASADCNVAGYCIPAGTRLMVNAWKLHRDPAVWPDPLVFRPERFLTTHKDVNVRGLDFELVPFGCGRRACPGNSFAVKFVQVTLASLLHQFDIESVTKDGVDMNGSCGSTNVKATPVEVLLKPRLDPSLYD